MVDGNQGAEVDQAILRARFHAIGSRLVRGADAGDVRASGSTTLPVPSRVALQPRALPEYLQRGACSGVQVDVERIGGITPWLKTAHLAEAFNVAVCRTFFMELHVALRPQPERPRIR
jgi:hypothetical protein